MLDMGLQISINSDDPAYFGAYVGDNYAQLSDVLGFGVEELADLARMSITSSFLAEDRKIELIDELGAVVADGPA
jgi:adenosine deaminase